MIVVHVLPDYRGVSVATPLCAFPGVSVSFSFFFSPLEETSGFVPGSSAVVSLCSEGGKRVVSSTVGFTAAFLESGRVQSWTLNQSWIQTKVRF
ncbi:hypothetical protein CHARACLAT_003338 [Characodon lateralis]|uniref:Uncharacterized protein n=1 Tax=Characodon lateralis TaxID=208331 RepID=A0ABU7EG14_9TELE|nr:hypothetical protein [Characodon lateralis]